MIESKDKIEEITNNTIRFVNVRKGEVGEPSIVIESRKQKCKDCGMTLWHGLSGNLCLQCLVKRKKK